MNKEEDNYYEVVTCSCGYENIIEVRYGTQYLNGNYCEKCF